MQCPSRLTAHLSPLSGRFVHCFLDGGQEIFDDAALAGFNLGLHGHAGGDQLVFACDLDGVAAELDLRGVDKAGRAHPAFLLAEMEVNAMSPQLTPPRL